MIFFDKKHTQKKNNHLHRTQYSFLKKKNTKKFKKK